MSEPMTAKELLDLIAQQAQLIEQLTATQCKCRPAIFADIPAQLGNHESNR